VVMTVSKSNHSVVIGYGKYTKHVARWIEFGFMHTKLGKYIGRHVGFFRNAVETASEPARAALQESLLNGIARAFKTGKVDAA